MRPRRDLKWPCSFLRSEAAGRCHEDGSDDSKGYVTATPFAKPFNPSRGKTIKVVAMSASPEAIAAIWEVAEVIFSPSSVRRARLVLDELGHSQNHNLGTLRVKWTAEGRTSTGDIAHIGPPSDAFSRQTCSLSGGSPHLSAIWRQTLAISVRTSNTTRFDACAGSQDRHAARNALIGSTDASAPRRKTVNQLVDIRLPHQLPPLLHQPQLQHLGLQLDVVSVSLTSWRLLPLAPQVSQVSNAALIEREAVTLPLDHAVGFELADVGPASIEVQRQCRRADGRGLWKRASSMVTVSVIVFVPVASR